jgi:PPOX class probable F420-dependent enzyme
VIDELGARRRFASARVARLATIRADGRPHIVPLCFVLDNDTLVSVVDGKPKRSADLLRLANVRAHDAVSLLVDHYDDDWTRLWWVRVDGVAEVVVAGAEHRDAIQQLAAKYPQYQVTPPSGPVLRVTVTGVAHWEAGGI